MVYHISIKKRASKDLEGINDPFYTEIKTVIYNLAKNPRPRGYKRLKNRDGYRIRVGDYRIIYDIFDDVLLVDVIGIGHRRDIYKK